MSLFHSHYTLIAVPVHKDKTQPITAEFTPLIPYNKVVGKAMSSHSASKSDKSVAFIIGTYPGNALPSAVVLGNTNEVLSAFKPNQYYVLVLVAFTRNKVTSGTGLCFHIVLNLYIHTYRKILCPYFLSVRLLFLLLSSVSNKLPSQE